MSRVIDRARARGHGASGGELARVQPWRSARLDRFTFGREGREGKMNKRRKMWGGGGVDMVDEHYSPL